MAKEDEIQTKKCKNECPACGADGVDDLKWGEKVFEDDVVYLEGTCNQCGQVFREFWDYCETEWVPTKKNL